MHPDHRHMTAASDDPDAALERRLEVARQRACPRSPCASRRRRAAASATASPGSSSPPASCCRGVTVATDLGVWEVVHTPGHAPSHVCLCQPERRILISGDHLLGRVSLYYDYGYTPDPAGEFLTSLDRVEALDARLCLSGHGRTFTDVQGHIAANRALVAQRLAALEECCAATARSPPSPRCHDSTARPSRR